MPEQFDFDISISADKQRRQSGRKNKTGEVETSSRTCQHPECRLQGKYRAPKSREKTDDYYWFCKAHVSEYNHNWNYYTAQIDKDDDSNENEFSEFGSAEEQRLAQQHHAWQRLGINDPLEILGESGTIRNSNDTSLHSRLTPDERRAIQILDVEASWSKSKIRHQYTSLVKIYHPDLNGGYRDEEDRLQLVIWAWGKIKSSKHFSN